MMLQRQMNEKQKPILVLGGNGKTGKRVAERLLSMGLPVRIGSRHSEQPFYWEDKSTWQKVLEDVAAVYIVYSPDLAVPCAAEDIKKFTKIALQNNVKRLVLLSGRGEEGAVKSENELKNSDADWTILRSGWFNQNFSEAFLLDQIREGIIALPVGKVTEPFIDIDDLAEVAVKVLTEDGHIGKLYELTGPRLMTFQEATNEISAVIQSNISYMKLTNQQFKEGLYEAETPAPTIELLMELFTSVLDGRNSFLGDGVQQVLGREPIDFTEYVQKTVKTGVWGE